MTRHHKEEKKGATAQPEGDLAMERPGDAAATVQETEAATEDWTAQLEAARKSAAENHDKYVRAVAELENYKKRAVREKAEAIKYGNEALLRDVLPLMDSLDRAMVHACASDDFEAFKTGLEMLRQQLQSCLEKHGVEQIEALGKAFDPNVHDAMMQVESGEHEPNEVVGEFEKGYLLNGRLLRPARVSVCKRSAGGDETNC